MKYRSLLRAIAILIVPVFVLSFVSRAEALGRGGGGRGGGFSREDAARGGGGFWQRVGRLFARRSVSATFAGLLKPA